MIAHQEMQAKVSHLISAIGKSIEYLQNNDESTPAVECR